MKKQFAVITAIAASIAITACSSGSGSTAGTTTSGAAESVTESAAEAGNAENTQDTSEAEESSTEEETAEDTQDSTASDEADITMDGTVESSDDSSMTVKADDGTHTFNTKIAQKVTNGGINAGVKVQVTYYGDLDDPDALPVATRIVTEDAKDTPEAAITTLTGTVSEVGSDHVILDTTDPDNTLFAFQGTEGMFDGVKVGDTITVIYTGSLTARTIPAVGIQE